MKKRLFILIGIVMMFSAKAQTAGDNSNSQASKKNEMEGKVAQHYFSFTYENESGGGPRNGASIGYMVSPSAKRKYYIGMNTSIMVLSKDDSYFKYHLSAFSLNLTHRVFLGQRAKVSPFLDFDLGCRMMNNSAEVPATYGAKASGILGAFGARYYIGGETTDTRTMTAFTGYVGVGYFIHLFKKSGMIARLGYRMTDQFELIDYNSVGTTQNHVSPDHQLGYDTYFTKSSFVTFSLGFTLGI